MKYTVDETKVIYADLDPTEGIVLHMDTKNYYRLNETGQIVWQSVTTGKSNDEIASKLADTFDVDKETAQADVDHLIKHFEQERLILRTSDTEEEHLSMEEARKSKKKTRFDQRNDIQRGMRCPGYKPNTERFRKKREERTGFQMPFRHLIFTRPIKSPL